MDNQTVQNWHVAHYRHTAGRVFEHFQLIYVNSLAVVFGVNFRS